MSNKLTLLKKTAFCRMMIIFISTVLFLPSCIPTKKVNYLSDASDGQQFSITKREYRINSGDRFYIQVSDPMSSISLGSFTNAAQNQQQLGNLIQQMPSVHDYVVNEKGNIDYPLIGEINAAGKTIYELRDEVYEKCKGFISNPSVKLFMTNYNVTVLGEVNAPGFYQLITDSPTFFDAIGLAGNLTDFARRNEIKLIRTTNDTITVHYLDVMSADFIQTPYYYVRPNDVIHIAPLKVKKYSSDNALPLVLSILTTIITVVSITSR